jgi:hypothetical protein
MTLRSAVLAVLVLASCGGAPEQGTADTSEPVPTEASATGVWRPPPRVSWQWQLTGAVDLSVDADVYDVDLFAVDAATVQALHDRGRKAICYLSAGSFEGWRPDAGRFPEEVLGRPLEDWPDERWLDIRRLDVLAPILGDRMDRCRTMGFDAVEPDNVDGYANDSGFPLTADDQLRFNRAVADLAHERGLGVGLKNDLDQVGELVDWFDFAVNEECAAYDECDLLEPFLAAGKAVLHVEYDLPVGEFCPQTVPLGFSSMRKRLELDAWREACPVT